MISQSNLLNLYITQDFEKKLSYCIDFLKQKSLFEYSDKQLQERVDNPAFAQLEDGLIPINSQFAQLAIESRKLLKEIGEI